MTLEKLLTSAKKLIATTLLSVSLTTPAKAEVKPIFSLGFNAGYEKSLISSINNIPLAIRNVPKHRDDGYASDSNVAPIAGSSIDLSETYPILGAKVGVGIGIHDTWEDDKFTFKVGIGAETWHPDKATNFYTADEFHSRNYTNAPGTDTRGEAAALTAYRVFTYYHKPDDNLKPYLFSEAGFHKDFLTLNLGYKIFKQGIIAENGWDRYNSFEKWNSHELAEYIVGSPYASVGCRFPCLTNCIGAVTLDTGLNHILKEELSSLGKQAAIDTAGASWFVGLSFNSYFPRERK